MSKLYGNKEEFLNWIDKNELSIDVLAAEKSANSFLAKQGDCTLDLFSICCPCTVYSIVIDMISKREQITIESVNDYAQAIMLMVTYAEFLISKGNDRSEQIEKDQEKTRDSLIVAYCLSRLNMEAVYALGYQTFRSAFNGLGKVLDQKPNTIKNMRDEFDPYFDNGRVGWYQRELRASRKQVFDDMALLDEKELLRLTEGIVNRYKEQKDSSKNRTHKTIIISNKNMKTHNASKK